MSGPTSIFSIDGRCESSSSHIIAFVRWKSCNAGITSSHVDKSVVRDLILR